MQPLGSDHAQAGVRVAQHEHGVRLRLGEELVRAVDDVPAGGPEVVPDCIHIDFRFSEFEIPEEDAVQVVVVVLAGMGEDHVKIFTALGDDRRQADNLRARTYYDTELEFAVLLPVNI